MAPTQSEIEAAESQGYSDFFSRKSINDNPYQRGDYNLYLAWNRGWYRGKREADAEKED